MSGGGMTSMTFRPFKAMTEVKSSNSSTSHPVLSFNAFRLITTAILDREKAALTNMALNAPIIIDNGTGYSKIGYGRKKQPLYNF